MNEPSFSIVVPTFRRPDALQATLGAIVSLDYPSDLYEVIVVDDGADTATADIIDAFCGGDIAFTLHTQHRRGAATARNRGASIATGDLLLFCDDDILIDRTHLRRHVSTRERHGDVIVNGAWMFAPRVVDALKTTPFGRYRLELEARFHEEARGEPLDDDLPCVTMSLLGSWDLALRRELFWTLGAFDEDFPVAGAEDQDFSLRATEAGCVLVLDTRIRCLHNDNRLSLRAYCAREERSAQTMPLLARKFPDRFAQTPYLRENRPIARNDPPSLIVRKLAKSLLATRPALEALHGAVTVLEAASAPDKVLRRFYRTLLGLYLFRGVRRTWA